MFMRRGRSASSTYAAFAVVCVWLASMVWLWSWWFDVIGTANLLLYIPLSLAIFYEYALMPGAFLYFILKAKAPPKRKLFPNKKVAVITPCVPASESLEIIERQLKAMSEIRYPHDSWILDEGNLKEIKQMARTYGVKYFSRKGIAKYNQDDYPLKAKTKAGNINAWLHKVRHKKYDFFVQLDIDHIPKPEYLDKTLGHFRDTKVGWVQAPSVYHNLKHWTARGSAELELGLQGPLQMGFYSNTEAPVIIGSHTTFRMKAIQEIGGFQATRAEDHLNTLALIDKGWKGFYLPEVIAEGEGPETLNAFIAQQYAWAFSMFQILRNHSWPYLKRMSLRKKLQFLFLQTWYPLWSLSYLIMFLVPVVGLFLNTHAVQSEGSDFIYRFMPALLSTLLSWHIAKPLFQPRGLGLSWRGMILHVIRWPMLLMAVVSAGLGHTKPYQITPKGKFLGSVPTIKLYRPFLLLSFISATAMLFYLTHYQNETPNGLLVFAGTNLVVMLSVCLVDLNMRLRQRKIKVHIFRRYWLRPTMAVASVLLFASLVLTISLSSWQQTIYAHIAPQPPKVSRDISLIPPQALTDAELMKEIASKEYVTKLQDHPSVGVHSPVVIPEQSGPYIRHSFVDWREDWRIQQELLISLRAHNTPLITIEPKGEPNGATLLQDIRDGKHDDTINRFIEIASQTDNDVYIRFAHEMELGNLYAWGGQDSHLFIEAYRHVVETAKQKGVTNIKWVWSPGGAQGAEAYYPGDDVVDVIGSTIIYDQYWQGDTYISFYNLAESRLWLNKYQKPLWAAELGLGKANPLLQNTMINEALAVHKDYGFSAVVFLNIPDSNFQGPDYRIDDLTILGGPFLSTPPAPLPSPPEKTENKPPKAELKKLSPPVLTPQSPFVL